MMEDMIKMEKDEIGNLEKINLTDIKIISTTGTPSDVIVIAGNKQLTGVVSVKFEINPSLLVGKVILEIIPKDVMIDAHSVELEIKEIKK